MKLHTFAAALALVGLSGTVLFAGGNHAKICKKNARPYSLALTALRGKTTTDVEVAVSAAAGWERPSRAKHVYLSGSFHHKHGWKRTLDHVDLEDGRIAISETEAVRGASVKSEVRVRTCTCGSEQVMKKSTLVLFRPDLRIGEVHAPAQVRAKQPVNIEIEVRELKGDLGATFDGRLAESDTILDEVTDASVSPAGTTSLLFTLAFDKPGTHQIAAMVGNSQPGEYDEANNVTTFQIEVLPAIEAASYSLNYDDWRWNLTRDYVHDDRIIHDASKGLAEYVRYGQSMPHRLAWPLQDVSIQLWADGARRMAHQIADMEPTTTWKDANSSIQTAQASWPEEGTWVYVSSYSSSNGCNSGVVVERYAVDEVWTSSAYHKFWGRLDGWNSQGSRKLGTFIHARQSLAAHMTVTDAAGRVYGGWGTAPAIQCRYQAPAPKPMNLYGFEGVEIMETEKWFAFKHGTTLPE